MAESTPAAAPRGGAEIAADLDRIAKRAQRPMRAWTWRRAVERGATAFFPAATLVPGVALAANAWGFFTGLWWWPLGGAATIGLAVALPIAGVLAVALIAYLRHPPSRARALAFYDHRLGLRDRLQAADELARRDAPSGFAQAAVLDAGAFARRALGASPPKVAWRPPALRLQRWPLGALAVFALAAALLLRGAIGPGAPGAATVAALGDLQAAAVEPDDERQEETPARAADRSLAAKTMPRPTDVSAFAARETGEAPPPGLGTRSDDLEQTSARAAQAQASQRGFGAAGASNQSAEQARRAPNKRAPRPDGKRRPATQRRREENASSGVPGGTGTSAGSRLASSDHPAADTKARNDEAQDEVEDDAEDEEDEEQKAASTRRPMLNNRKAPVDRSLTPSGVGDQERDDLNGRGGPGGLKKTRGVAAMLLGVPMPDHLRGKPNPGRVKVRRERSPPEEKTALPVDAAARGSRDQPFGHVNHLRLPPPARGTVRDYFLAQRARPEPLREEP